jgi:DNA-binding PadR family transcriptional regulator
MSKLRLSTTSYVVLGLIGLRGPSTSYDLKRAIARSVGYFWHFPHAQLYSEPRRLAVGGLLEVTAEESGRRRQTFSLTDLGEQRLREWLSEPSTDPMQIRDVAELKLFLAELSTPEDTLALAREQVAQHEARIATYDSIMERYSELDPVAARLVPVRLGLKIEHAAHEFWRELVEELEDR